MNIRIEVSRCPHPWLKLVTGTDPVFHLVGEFIPLKSISAKYKVVEVTSPGIYWGPKIGKGQVVAGGRRIDSGIFQIDNEGKVIEMTLIDARAYFDKPNGFIEWLNA